MKRSFADILAGLDGERAGKVARKLPEWAAVDGIEIPSALALEQCSSSVTARFKAGLAASTLRSGQLPLKTSDCVGPLPSDDGPLPLTVPRVARFSGAVAADVSPEAARLTTVLDLTGGLGVDSWAFSQVAERVVYYERDAGLAAAAERDFTRLGADNIEVRCETVTPETDLPEADLIFADPARRSATGRKVFLLEDCTPDILTLLPLLLQKAPAVLLKLSPMADLTMLSERLGPALREIHVVEHDGEVKELLCLLCRRSDFHPLHPLKGDGTQIIDARVRQRTPAEPEIAVVRLASGGAGAPCGQNKRPRSAAETPAGGILPAGAPNPAILRFNPREERDAEAVYAASVEPGETLLEPCPALLKAGAFRLPCKRWDLRKLAPSTHLYLSPAPSGTINPPGVPGSPLSAFPGTETGSSVPDSRFFKTWLVREVLPFRAAAFKDLKQRCPRAEITARNLPLGSEELRKKMGISPGGDAHIFACRLTDGSAVLIVTERSPEELPAASHPGA